MDLLIWLVILLVIVVGAFTYRPVDCRQAKRSGTFAWWQCQRRRNRGWWL